MGEKYLTDFRLPILMLFDILISCNRSSYHEVN